MHFTSAIVGGMYPLLSLSGYQALNMLTFMPTALLATLALSGPVPRSTETYNEATMTASDWATGDANMLDALNQVAGVTKLGGLLGGFFR
ncbi:hypothetical protein PG985_000466 [Apiospora marii]|uniref:Uncharacterized protein n=1 Tax=Apiospora marii TaxID=335849 RepID=A0ABR1R2T9_9PEZI